MKPEKTIKQTHGDITPGKGRHHLPLPFQAVCYGSNLVTGHTYRHVMADNNPIPFAIFQYTLDGCGEYINKGKRNDIPPGAACFMTTPSTSIYQQHPDYDSYHFAYISIRGESALAIVNQIIRRSGNILALGADSKSIRMLCQHIIDLRTSNRPFDDFKESVFVYDFLLTLWREQLPKTNKNCEQMPESLERAAEYIEKHLSNPLLDLSDLAKEAKISRCYFTRLFQKFYGTSPRKYLLERRLNEAMQMLLNERECHLKDIIDKCGFTSETYFCYAFRKMYHQSPGTFRKHNLGIF